MAKKRASRKKVAVKASAKNNVPVSFRPFATRSPKTDLIILVAIVAIIALLIMFIKAAGN